ncbi:hypothetical protein BCR34DRAFT_590441 [Clohesyomyces aquaticus]|uniref:Uncharacterized protein n=1 Tax=Clohesyomyces aquaticus TaxID=1231657 RepID=A0A1Y1Z9U6_9PLEO|nr:hypothetical protein BCR34DRAFT_590441 [Clohesyomyces aquaticus]
MGLVHEVERLGHSLIGGKAGSAVTAEETAASRRPRSAQRRSTGVEQRRGGTARYPAEKAPASVEASQPRGRQENAQDPGGRDLRCGAAGPGGKTAKDGGTEEGCCGRISEQAVPAHRGKDCPRLALCWPQVPPSGEECAARVLVAQEGRICEVRKNLRPVRQNSRPDRQNSRPGAAKEFTTCNTTKPA